MHVFEFVIFIVVIGVIGGILRDRQRIKAGYPPSFSRKRHKHNDGMDMGMGMGCPLCAGLFDNGEGAEEMEAKIEKLAALEERVQVLEKIVTDKGRSLADEIDGL